tara:strand:+ start:692 stop:865 length:174 start_codon:yes stop_codon:yes gene_type:complete
MQKSKGMIKGNFDVKKIDKEKHSETEEFEELIQKAGYGSHMVFKNKKSEDDFFLEEI